MWISSEKEIVEGGGMLTGSADVSNPDLRSTDGRETP